MNPQIGPLAQLALKARNQSYSPYSQCKVGAALRTKTGEIFTGCNVENASYGGSVCAERVAIFKAVSEIGPSLQISELCVATDASPPWEPCGFCRQVLQEFSDEKCAISLVNPQGELIHSTLGKLFPNGFKKSSLGK